MSSCNNSDNGSNRKEIESNAKIEFLQQTIEMVQQQTIEILQEGWRG